MAKSRNNCCCQHDRTKHTKGPTNMTREHLPPDRDDDVATVLPAGIDRWKRLAVRLAIVAIVPAVVLLVAFLMVWSAFFKYVPAGKHLVIIAKNGDPLDTGEV